MPILNTNDRKCFRGRVAVILIYSALILGGITMVVPFMITLTGSVSTDFDYVRRSPLPRFLWSSPDRLMRTLCSYFPSARRSSLAQMRGYFPSLPAEWRTWAQVGEDAAGSDAWARQQLARLDDPVSRVRLETMTRDYGDFCKTLDKRETVLAYDARYVAPFLRQQYGSVEALNAAWGIDVDDFSKVSSSVWSGEPIDQRGYMPGGDRRYLDLLVFRDAYRNHTYTPFLRGEWDQANYLRPAALAYIWQEYAGKALNLSDPQRLAELPFPVPETAPAEVRKAWDGFLVSRFPLRHIRIPVSETRQLDYRRFVEDRFRNLDYLNRMLGATNSVSAWSEIVLTESFPTGGIARVWLDYVTTSVPVREWVIQPSLPEIAFQRFAVGRHGSLEAINRAYGLNLSTVEQLRIPFGEALLVSFYHHEFSYTWNQMTAGYRAVGDFLFRRGRAAGNTVILVVLAILVNLTVNPLAGYALSRFRLAQTEKIVVFCLATSAFPGAIAAIPGFLLLRDLGMLNTFAALVLPGAACGMSIFMLKGFFDSLPQELFEAATIDGASEWRIFFNVALPLVRPILAVGVLGSFIAAYNGWEWAIVVCQNSDLWTIAVWTYQFSQTAAGQPYTVMAAFVINSIPVFLVFLFCQKIILRGIILPQMK